MHSAAAVSDIGRNHFLNCHTYRKKNKNTQTAATNALSLQGEMKRKKDNLAKKKGMENLTDVFIESLVYYGMGESEACWRLCRMLFGV
jgi:hypothetical protein